MRAGGRGAESGFTLLELSIAFLISLVVLLLAGRLLLEAESRLAHAARRATEPVGELAAEQLRADLRAATGVEAALVSGWSRDPLVLRGHPAGELSFRTEGGVLYRRVERPGGAASRPLLADVHTFRWRLRGRVVEVDLRHRETPRLGRLAAGGVREAPLVAERRFLLRTAPRGGGGERW